MQWDGQIIDLAKGEQNNPDYLAVNPRGVVPALDVGGLILLESNVILEYLSDIADIAGFMPEDPQARAAARMWLADSSEAHAAVNTLTYVTSKRRKILDKKTPEEIEASIAKMANPANAFKRSELLELGIASTHVTAALFALKLLFAKMSAALSQRPWVLGNTYCIADAALVPHVDRLDRLGLSPMWTRSFPAITVWLAEARKRRSYEVAIRSYAGNPRDESATAQGWDMVAPLWRPTG